MQPGRKDKILETSAVLGGVGANHEDCRGGRDGGGGGLMGDAVDAVHSRETREILFYFTLSAKMHEGEDPSSFLPCTSSGSKETPRYVSRDESTVSFLLIAM